ncbi:hypothetical protein HUG10_21080 (plasmid) [Halorarum halophilum]|uniref:SWIM-type domain-containing protein n=1 Tax=Halorarum halophilum TaxID=2743090 RepID=A0A7D5KQ44_9EURY|nr:hypothetical protein [Halobaculum halophilum]QLG30082.1 hypothetical protein HUG10_21080 [Halobaculum halophilum]
MTQQTQATDAQTTQKPLTQVDDFDPTQHVVGFNAATMKRAKWEEFEFTVLESGNVEVRNASHGDDADAHVYHVVTDASGNPKWCLHALEDDVDDDWEPCPAMAFHAAPKNRATGKDTEDLIADGEYRVCKHALAYARNEAIVRTVRQVKRDGGEN